MRPSYRTEKRGSGRSSFIIMSFRSYLTVSNTILRLCASLFTRSVTESHNLCRLFVVIHLWSTPLVKRRFDKVKSFLLIAVTLQENSSLIVDSQWSECFVPLANIASESGHSNLGRRADSTNYSSPRKKKKKKNWKRKYFNTIHYPWSKIWQIETYMLRCMIAWKLHELSWAESPSLRDSRAGWLLSSLSYSLFSNIY